MKDYIKNYIFKTYAVQYYWGRLEDKYGVAISTVVGHLSFLILLPILFVLATLSKFGLIQWTITLKEYRFVLLGVAGLVLYFMVVRPLEKKIKKIATKTEVEALPVEHKYAKKKVLLFYILQLLAIPFMLVAMGLFIKFIWLPML